MFLRKSDQTNQKRDENLFSLDLKKLEEYVTRLKYDCWRPKYILSEKLFKLLSAEKENPDPDFSRIKKILIAAYIENNRLEKDIDKKGIIYRYAVMQGSRDLKYQFDFEGAILQVNDENIPKKIDRGLLGFAKSQNLQKIIYNLFE